MILGFAHLAINTGDLIGAEKDWARYNYMRTAVYNKVPNHPTKQAFTNSYQSEHDLILINWPRLWPLELTCHGPTKGENRQIAWSPSAICVLLSDPLPFQHLLLRGLGFQKTEDNQLQLDSRLPGWCCRLHLTIGESNPVRLDAEGPTCLAFYCNRIEEDAALLIKLGATEYSGPFETLLWGKKE